MPHRVVEALGPPSAAAGARRLSEHPFEDVLLVEVHFAHVQRCHQRGGHAPEPNLREAVERQLPGIRVPTHSDDGHKPWSVAKKWCCTYSMNVGTPG
jgi:hypothetical protein